MTSHDQLTKTFNFYRIFISISCRTQCELKFSLFSVFHFIVSQAHCISLTHIPCEQAPKWDTGRRLKSSSLARLTKYKQSLHYHGTYSCNRSVLSDGLPKNKDCMNLESKWLPFWELSQHRLLQIKVTFTTCKPWSTLCLHCKVSKTLN